MTGPRVSAPPGRAGRIWLDRRLAAARRGAELLDRKLRILRAELSDLADAAGQAEQDWRRLAAAADRTLLIASLLGGQRAIRLATGTGFAAVEVSYTATMGVRRPAGAACRPPQGPDPWTSQPVAQARQAHRAALAGAVRYATAARALAVVEAEAQLTRYRLRAIEDRLIPALEQARTEVSAAIDELERADGARLRRAGRQPGTAGPSPSSWRAAQD